MEFVKKHLLTIICVLSIILLALPLVSVESEVEMFGASSSASATVTGFSALGKSVFAYILILGPALLVAMNYVKQLERYKGLLAIGIPVICLIALVIVVISANSFSASASNDYASAEVSVKLGIGTFLVAISHIGTAVVGAMEYHGFTFNKAGVDNLKKSISDSVPGKKAE